MRKIVLVSVIICGAIFSAEVPPGAPLQDRWVYFQTNLWVDKNVDSLLQVMRDSAKDGYTGVLLADSKFGKLGDMDARYFKNVEKVKAAAAELKLDIIPGIFPIGYSGDILWHDPNLAEALPVREAPFLVKGGEARIVPDVRELKKYGFKDDVVTDQDGVWKTEDPRGKNARVTFKQKVQPFRQYHISVDVKTQDFKGQPEIKVLAGEADLQPAYLGIPPTQEWTTVHTVFDSLDHTEVNLYFGCWGGKTGTLEWRNARMEETGLVNLVRRDGAPLVVAKATGEALTEGKDFERVSDPKMGKTPWNGAYDMYHEPPVIKTSLPDGTQLKVSYCFVKTVMDAQVMICPSEPKTYELLKDHAERVHKAFGARKYMMSFDEIRTLNWCEGCQKRNLDAGPLLADMAQKCIKIMREVAPEAKLYTWNDMFDPNHNAHKNYYLVRGDLTGSWEGLDKDVTIVAWYFEHRDMSFPFFAKRGHPILVAGYYDGGQDTKQWLESMKKSPNIVGIMYTTWEHNYGEMEKFARTVREYFPW